MTRLKQEKENRFLCQIEEEEENKSDIQFKMKNKKNILQVIRWVHAMLGLPDLKNRLGR